MANINIYSTRTMMAAINRMKPVNTFLRDTFFPNVETFVTEHIDVDFKKGKRKMAPFVAPRVGGITMDRQGYVTRTYTPPRIAPQRVLTKDDIAARAMGEAVYSVQTPEQRAAALLGSDLAELDEYITRREEWLCREILINGTVTMKGFIDANGSNTVDQVVDYNLTNKEILAGVDKWDQGTSTKYDDLKRWRLEVIQKSGKAPTICIMASDVVDDFLSDPDIRARFNAFNFNLGLIQPSVQSDGVTYIGKIAELALEIYSYDSWFIDDAGVEQPMMPAGNVLLARPSMAKILYAAVTQMDKGQFITYEGTRIPRQWSDEDNEVKMLKISARPLPVPEDIDDWFVAKVK